MHIHTSTRVYCLILSSIIKKCLWCHNVQASYKNRSLQSSLEVHLDWRPYMYTRVHVYTFICCNIYVHLYIDIYNYIYILVYQNCKFISLEQGCKKYITF